MIQVPLLTPNQHQTQLVEHQTKQVHCLQVCLAFYASCVKDKRIVFLCACLDLWELGLQKALINADTGRGHDEQSCAEGSLQKHWPPLTVTV